MTWVKKILGQGLHRQFSSSSSHSKFEHYLAFRRQQAEKSILVQVQGLNSCPEVSNYLTKKFGPIQSLYHYAIPSKGKWSSSGSAPSMPPTDGGYHWLLAEFENRNDFVKAINSCGFAEGTMPYTSAMTWFAHKNKSPSHKKEIDIPSERLGSVSSEAKFAKGMNLSQQLQILEDSVKLSDLGVRVRFFIACQLETAFKGMFPQGCVLPFGSSVSGIGSQSGDLDLVLLQNKSEIFKDTGKTGGSKELFFQSKMQTTGNGSNNRPHLQRVLEIIADNIHVFIPGYTRVQRILGARVPILRFWSDYTELQCDLSMTNASGVHMSELIYIMTKLDPRFPTLLFAVRSWASARKITNPVPGRQPTNFMFVLLLIYFLQTKKILPTLDVLFNNPSKSDVRTTSDGIDCTFLRQTDQILKFFTPQCKSESVAELLFEFFSFYSEFDFNTKGVTLLTGSAWGKPDAGAMYIQNPLERHLNVARNVSREEVSRFKSKAKEFLFMGKGLNLISDSNYKSQSKVKQR